MSFKHNSPSGVIVMLERRRTHHAVGTLTKQGARYVFEYDMQYIRLPSAIPLGPEMPLSRRRFESTELFRPFLERIPSKENPAYPEYCRSVGIDENETDSFVLLSTIASRGPSSFLFFPCLPKL